MRDAALAVARLSGGVLSGATAGLAALRSRAKPLHPRGEVWQGRVVRSGNPASATGVVWLDEPGEDEVLVRLSAAIGLPSLTWDIAGLAIRLPDEADADVLFATTGAGPLTRFVLLPTLASHESGLTTLLPYRTPVGPLFLRAVPDGKSGPGASTRYTLAYARGLRGWVDFARLELVQRSEAHVSFDPVLSSPPGLGIYPWVALLRAPAYARARRSRGDSAAEA